jgi:hypothetical protein
MKQIIRVQRVEHRVIELDTLQPLSKDTLTQLVNDRLTGLGAPALGLTVNHQIMDWAVTRIEPSCECTQPKRSSKRKN